MAAKTGAGHGKHRPVSQRQELQPGVEQAQDADLQPSPRPGRHQHRIAHIDAPVGQVAFDQRPLAQEVAPGQALLALGAFR